MSRAYQGSGGWDNMLDFLRKKGPSFESMFKPGGGTAQRWGGTPGSIGQTNRQTGQWMTDPAAQQDWQNQQFNFFGQVAQSAFDTAAQQQEAANEQWKRNEAQIAQLQGMVDRGGGQIREAGAAGQKALRTDADKMEAEAAGRSGAILDEVTGRVDEANKTAAQAVEDMLVAKQELKDLTAEQMSSTAAAIGESAKQQDALLATGLNPDGTRMTPEQLQAARGQAYASKMQMRQQANTQIQGQYNQNLLQVNMGVAGMRQGQAQIELAGAGTVGQTGVALAGQQTQVAQVAAGLRHAAETMKGAAEMNALQFEWQGQLEIADAVRRNPQGVINMFALMKELLAMAVTPGIQKFQGLNYEALT